jgi:hypothetical protein
MQPEVPEGPPFVLSTHGDKDKFQVMKFVLPTRFQEHNL